jgi:predicted HAD superfamily Cof-like phosphohydrolase
MSIRQSAKQVKEWCEATEIKTSETPVLIDANRTLLRFNLMAEENQEYLDAVNDNDIVGIADALGDMLYILLGTALEHGLHNHLDRIFNEIHRSNMSKMDENGNPIRREDGKILKGPKYFRPNITQIIKQ